MNVCQCRPVGRWFTSSTQPISTSLCPVSGSRPVVSVSSTISRMPPTPSLHFAPPNPLHDPHHRPSRQPATEPRRYDEIGTATLLRIRHLLAADRFELLARHAGSRQHALGDRKSTRLNSSH